jgi:hypothetical protein
MTGQIVIVSIVGSMAGGVTALLGWALLRQKLAWLQWATPALTGSLLVLDAQLGEQQRGLAGLLDRRW